MSNYTKITDYAAKDVLLHNDPLKAIKGTEVGAEFDAIATMSKTKADSGANADITSMTALTAPTAAANPVRATDLQVQLTTAFTTGGTSTAFTLTPTPAISAYVAGIEFDITFNAACGASPTLQISGLATPPNLVKQIKAGTFINIAAGDIPANHRSKVVLLSATQALVRNLPPVDKAVLTFRSSGVAGGATEYMDSSVSNATEIAAAYPVPFACTVSSLYVRSQVAPGSGQNFNYVLFKNGVGQTLGLTIADTAVSNSDLTNSVSFAAGDLISLRLIASGSAATTVHHGSAVATLA